MAFAHDNRSGTRRFLWSVSCVLIAGVAVAEEPTPPTFPSYRNDVTPVFTRFGCNMGACHGKLAGQNGFKLSLRGYAPEMDYAHLVREDSQRRVNRLVPEESLLLMKPAGAVPHGGGRIFHPESPAYKIVADWMRGGMPGPSAEDPVVTKLEITPTAQTLRVGEKVSLKAVAHYSNSTTRDVTWLAKFDSNDAGILAVTADGQVEALRHGETSVRIAFMDQVEIARFTMPNDAAVDANLFAERRNVLDLHIFDKLQSLRIPPSAACDDATFLRRAFLDTIGTLPTPDEVKSFLADTTADKRAKAVDALFARPEFVDFWTLKLCDLLQNRKERDHDVRGSKGVRSFQAWVRTQVAADRPWNEIARDVLLSKGSVVENPATGYYITVVGEQQPERSEVADSVAQAFLGTRIGCARCHNHPLEKYTQDDYYHFVAFFSRVALDRKSPMEGETVLHLGTNHTLNLDRQRQQERDKLAQLQAAARDGVDLDKKPLDEKQKAEQQKQIADLEKRIADLEKQKADALKQPVQVGQPRTGKAMKPQPLDRSAVEVPEAADPREQFVAWMTRPDNEYFAGAMVNRLWKHFFREGMVEPVDDLRATNPPSNPALWAAANKEFVDSGFRLKHVMRLILTSRAYQLASTTLPENAVETRYYSHYYARRLSAEVVSDAISEVTGIPDAFPGYPVGLRAVQLPGPEVSSYFLSLFGRSDRVTSCACERNEAVTLPQLLHLINDNSLGDRICHANGRLSKLLAAEPDNNRALDELYLLLWGRKPMAADLPAVRAHIETTTVTDSRAIAFQDVFWALMNAKEFQFNH